MGGGGVWGGCIEVEGMRWGVEVGWKGGEEWWSVRVVCKENLNAEVEELRVMNCTRHVCIIERCLS